MSSPNDTTPAIPQCTNPSRTNGLPWLMGSIALMIVVWGLVLPAIGRLPTVRDRIDFLESRGVDPSAKFFTDQEAGPRNAALVRAKTTEHPEYFWSFERPANQ